MINPTDFLEYLRRASPARRLVLAPNEAEYEKLRSRAIGGNFYELNFASLLPPAFTFPPDITEILLRLNEKAATSAGGKLVTGLNHYLYLLDPALRKQAVYQLARWLERPNEDNILIIARYAPRLAEALGNYSGLHRLKEWRRFVELSGSREEPTIRAELVSPAVAPICERLYGELHTLPEFLTRGCGEIKEESCYVTLDAPCWPIAGLNPDITQHHTASRLLNEIYEDKVDDLSAEARDWLLNFAAKPKPTQGGVAKISSRLILKSFFEDERPETDILRKWRSMNRSQREILLWILTGAGAKDPYLSDSYLLAVRNLPGVDANNFESAYAEGWIIDKKAWAEERRQALINAGIDGYKASVELFIARHKNEPSEKIAPWLNCGTLAERAEILRRRHASEISPILVEAYPEIAAYLSEEPGILDDYFSTYRKLVIRDDLNANFMRLQTEARDKLLTFPSRDGVLQRYAGEGALLVVDALGAAWTPMLVNLARERGLEIIAAEVGRANLPTITSKNIINWSGPRLPDVKSLDNVAHNGVEAHERRSPEENLAAALEIPERICTEVKKGLFDYPRVVVTGDHGASRLASLAIERNEFSRKLETSSERGGARYSLSKDAQNYEDNLTASLDGDYLCINNYDYFYKTGARNFAVHGGATPEEWLVPVLVFALPAASRVEVKATAQIIEDPDFDI